jgi:hypothetical protein
VITQDFNPFHVHCHSRFMLFKHSLHRGHNGEVIWMCTYFIYKITDHNLDEILVLQACNKSCQENLVFVHIGQM